MAETRRLEYGPVDGYTLCQNVINDTFYR